MNHTTFDVFARRAAGRKDRRSLFGGLSAALLPIVGFPLAAEAKNKHKRKRKRRKRNRKAKSCQQEKECRATAIPQCAIFPEVKNCKDKVKHCCEKACQSFDEASQCVEAIE